MDTEVKQAFLPKANHPTEVNLDDSKLCCYCFRRRLVKSKDEDAVENAKKPKESGKGSIGIIVGLLLFSLVYYFSKDAPYQVEPVGGAQRVWICSDPAIGKCVKRTEDGFAGGLNRCLMTCGDKSIFLWPEVNGIVNLSNRVFNFLPSDVIIMKDTKEWEREISFDTRGADSFLRDHFYSVHPKFVFGSQSQPFPAHFTQIKIILKLSIVDKLQSEEYQLSLKRRFDLSSEGNIFHARIRASDLSGLRHGLESFTQLTTFDDVTDTLQLYDGIFVHDRPGFKYRSLLVDSTFEPDLSETSLREFVRAMTYAKMNVLHWRLTNESAHRIMGGWNDLLAFNDFAKSHRVKIVPEIVQENCGKGGKCHNCQLVNAFGNNILAIAIEECLSINGFSEEIKKMTGNGYEFLTYSATSAALKGKYDTNSILNLFDVEDISGENYNETCSSSRSFPKKEDRIGQIFSGGELLFPMKDLSGVSGGIWRKGFIERAAELWSNTTTSDWRRTDIHLRRMRNRGISVYSILPTSCWYQDDLLCRFLIDESPVINE